MIDLHIQFTGSQIAGGMEVIGIITVAYWFFRWIMKVYS